MKQLRNKRELYASGLMMLIGIGTVAGALNYDVKSLERMGPGYFPLMLGVGLMMVSALMFVSIEPAAEGETRRAPSLRAFLFVTAGIVAFMVFGRYGGLVPASFAIVLLSALGDESNSLTSALALALGMTIAAVVVFHFGLQMQFPLFRWG